MDDHAYAEMALNDARRYARNAEKGSAVRDCAAGALRAARRSWRHPLCEDDSKANLATMWATCAGLWSCATCHYWIHDCFPSDGGTCTRRRNKARAEGVKHEARARSETRRLAAMEIANRRGDYAMKTRSKFVCSECDREDLRFDAWAVWDEDCQDWKVNEVNEWIAYCYDCGEVSAKEIETEEVRG